MKTAVPKTLTDEFYYPFRDEVITMSCKQLQKINVEGILGNSRHKAMHYLTKKQSHHMPRWTQWFLIITDIQVSTKFYQINPRNIQGWPNITAKGELISGMKGWFNIWKTMLLYQRNYLRRKDLIIVPTKAENCLKNLMFTDGKISLGIGQNFFNLW